MWAIKVGFRCGIGVCRGCSCDLPESSSIFIKVWLIGASRAGNLCVICAGRVINAINGKIRTKRPRAIHVHGGWLSGKNRSLRNRQVFNVNKIIGRGGGCLPLKESDVFGKYSGRDGFFGGFFMDFSHLYVVINHLSVRCTFWWSCGGWEGTQMPPSVTEGLSVNVNLAKFNFRGRSPTLANFIILRPSTPGRLPFSGWEETESTPCEITPT